MLSYFLLKIAKRHEKVYNVPERPTLIKYRIYPEVISLFTNSGCTGTPSERTTWKNGKKYAAAMRKSFTNLKI
jgi:hypothetical protein